MGADLLHNSKILDESKDSKKTKLRDYAESKYIQQMQVSLPAYETDYPNVSWSLIDNVCHFVYNLKFITILTLVISSYNYYL